LVQDTLQQGFALVPRSHRDCLFTKFALWKVVKDHFFYLIGPVKARSLFYAARPVHKENYNSCGMVD
jgi:hypothetical protein